MIIECEYCHKSIEREPSKVRSRQHHYCNIVCYNKATKRKYTYPYLLGQCKECGKDIFVNDSSYTGKVRTKHFCNKTCIMKYRNRLIWTPEARRKQGENARRINRGKVRSFEAKIHYALANIGDKSHFWLGGKTDKSREIRNCFRMVDWKKAVLKRDNYTCLLCGKQGGYLEADHIEPFSVRLQRLINKSGQDNLYEKALCYEPLWDINNGRTLCPNCHRKTDTFALRTNDKRWDLLYKEFLE